MLTVNEDTFPSRLLLSFTLDASRMSRITEHRMPVWPAAQHVSLLNVTRVDRSLVILTYSGRPGAALERRKAGR